MERTSLIVPVYSANAELLGIAQDCLDSLEYGRPDELVVVDDGSPVPFSWSRQVDHLIQLTENGGYVSAVNRGLAVAMGSILIVGNSDLLFLPDWLHHLVQPLREGYDISSIRTTEPDGWETEDRLEENAKFGCLFALTKRTYEDLGGLDGRFLHYFADTDYRRRALNAGYRIAKNHRGLVAHKGSATYDIADPGDTRVAADARTFVAIHGFLE